MRIGTVAKKAGVGVETIRFYERIGIIDQPQKPANGGFRRYPDGVVRKVRFIKHAQALGFTLSEADELLALETDPNADCAKVRARAEVKLGSIRRKIASLNTIEAALGDIIDACPGRGVATGRCSILATLKSAENGLQEQFREHIDFDGE